MIKAVIFDFFGVLATRGLKQFKKTYFKGDADKIRAGKSLQKKLDSGDIGYDDYIDKLAEIGGATREKVLEYTENYKPNEKLLNYIRSALKPRYKLGIISNAGQDWVLKIIGEDNKQLFDDVILSYKAKVIKPEPEIYEMSLHHLGIEPHEAVFVDDILSYCEAARKMGMQFIWYKKFDDFKEELEEILAASADN
jgi:epoxide hydrolase-like predicted phosphatase